MNPTGPTLLQGRPYTPSVGTDVRETWKRYGWAPKARYEAVYCSQCGKGFGPGNEGFSHCRDHAGLAAKEV